MNVVPTSNIYPYYATAAPPPPHMSMAPSPNVQVLPQYYYYNPVPNAAEAGPITITRPVSYPTISGHPISQTPPLPGHNSSFHPSQSFNLQNSHPDHVSMELINKGQPQMNSTLVYPAPQRFNSNQSNQDPITRPPSSGRTSPIAMEHNNNHTLIDSSLYQHASRRPRIITTMWEDEGTLCYQVEANSVSVIRRADNDMINGTKLLNVTKMTRGRRDGILRTEKIRKVVKIGSMHLKGVWIPFDRAYEIARREKILDLLYPLFVQDIKGFLRQSQQMIDTGERREGNMRITRVPTPPLQHNTYPPHSQNVVGLIPNYQMHRMDSNHSDVQNFPSPHVTNHHTTLVQPHGNSFHVMLSHPPTHPHQHLIQTPDASNRNSTTNLHTHSYHISPTMPPPARLRKHTHVGTMQYVPQHERQSNEIKEVERTLSLPQLSEVIRQSSQIDISGKRPFQDVISHCNRNKIRSTEGNRNKIPKLNSPALTVEKKQENLSDKGPTNSHK
ncbi:Phd1p NDAI_0K01760 [Naumovozyma dairenensis CBS 421]|uniref:HTH APSES-type domain-containing protein n=1 Tax=Naumovozyma dairenensis (strain ATCC 10597 / BCRC 20456 / CBS 421 / NBRC 0211 / NRRL Y-12639) TaxID=1071378 RepID=G0WHV6_NAUDC|nr:hypothetical protein NDAI_0K01760 [Naumovozyma dairenensis CBS 421]CCD27367.1 hypothetical protein NDAI_0K01760 [Naumovozyma dairenensis CBS 421]